MIMMITSQTTQLAANRKGTNGVSTNGATANLMFC